MQITKYFSAELMIYKITHQTGRNKHDDGDAGDSYKFTLIGTKTETQPATCFADRSRGRTDTCSIRDRADIGKLTGIRIVNKSNNRWRFVSMTVQINGITRGRHIGSVNVDDRQTVNQRLNYIGNYFIDRLY